MFDDFFRFYRFGRNQTKTLLGIETITVVFSVSIGFAAAIKLKPY